MTMICNEPTKKALKEKIAAGVRVTITDPAFLPEWRKYGSVFGVDAIKPGDSIVVTNHPKRSWFASIANKGGKLVVS